MRFFTAYGGTGSKVGCAGSEDLLSRNPGENQEGRVSLSREGHSPSNEMWPLIEYDTTSFWC